MVHVIKVYLEDGKNETKIRRVAVSSDIVSYVNLLKDKIRELFELGDKTMELKWKDPENDFIIISSDGELAQCLANAEDGLLKVYVTIKRVGNKNEKLKLRICLDEKPKKLLHPFVTCDACEREILGVRYKCLQCRDFDICTECNSLEAHPHHDMVKLILPTDVPRDWVYMGARKMWRSMFGRCPSAFFPHCRKGHPPALGNPIFAQAIPRPANKTAKLLTPFNEYARRGFPPGKEVYQFPEPMDLPLFSALHGVFRAGMDAAKDKLEEPGNIAQEGKNQPSAPAQPMSAENVKPNEKEMSKPEREVIIFDLTDESDSESDETTPSPDAPKMPNRMIGPGLFTTAKVSSPSMEDSSDGWTLLHGVQNVVQEACAAAHEACAAVVAAQEASAAAAHEASAATGDADKKAAEPEKVVAYPSLEKEEVKPVVKEQAEIQSTDPLILSAMATMQAMGFTNEGGWLEKLLVTKNGNLNETLDALYPAGQRH